MDQIWRICNRNRTRVDLGERAADSLVAQLIIMSTTSPRTTRRIVVETPYETSDLYLAAYLALQGCQFTGTKDRDDGRSGLVFLFEERAKSVELAKAWMLQKDPHVSAFQYATQVKRLKNVIAQGGV